MTVAGTAGKPRLPEHVPESRYVSYQHLLISVPWKPSVTTSVSLPSLRRAGRTPHSHASVGLTHTNPNSFRSILKNTREMRVCSPSVPHMKDVSQKLLQMAPQTLVTA